jgi:uncharacterized protein (DUF427 family)
LSTRQRDVINSRLGSLRHEPIGVRIRAELDGATVLDTTRAVLVWEPRRVVCQYAVPIADLHGELHPTNPGGDLPDIPERGPLSTSLPFAVHTSDGQSCDVRAGNRILAGAAFRPADRDLAELVVLDFGAFDAWFQEDEPNIGHPRDPYHRIDIYPSSRHVRVSLGATVVAESARPMVLFEAMFPPRYYLPREDVRVELTQTDTSTVCPYKGWASYWSADLDGTRVDDVAWGYLDPLVECEQVRELVCFDDSKVTVTVDPG